MTRKWTALVVVCASLVLSVGCASAPPATGRLVAYPEGEFRTLLEAKGYPRGKTPAVVRPTADRAGLVVDFDPYGPHVAYTFRAGAARAESEAQASAVEYPPGSGVALAPGQVLSDAGAFIATSDRGTVRVQRGEVVFFSGRDLGTPAALWSLGGGRLVLVTSASIAPTRKGEGPTPVLRVVVIEGGREVLRRDVIADRVVDVDGEGETLLAERVSLEHLYGGTTRHLVRRFVVNWRSGERAELPALSGADTEVPRAFFLREDPLRK